VISSSSICYSNQTLGAILAILPIWRSSHFGGFGTPTVGGYATSLLQRARDATDQAQMHVGESFIATNKGGEVHSFTEVGAFGGGVVPVLNQLSNSGPTRPDCVAHTNNSFVAPGQSFTDTEGPNDVGHPVLYQCCIHPRMHETITVRP
jgi:hypothetical protein